MGAIWLNNIRPGGVHMFCMQPLKTINTVTHWFAKNLKLVLKNIHQFVKKYNGELSNFM